MLPMPSISIDVDSIATIHTPFKQKFAIPRQPNLADARGTIYFHGEYAQPQCFKGIENYSHLWLLFHFHETAQRGWKPAVKAPRLGGNATLGVFASRSTHRPNGIGMSVVRNGGLTIENGKAVLTVFGVDLLHETPIIDIKPYVRYADAVSHATDNLDSIGTIPRREVQFSPQAQRQLQDISIRYADAASLITTILAQDPRPAYKQHRDDDDKEYRVELYDFDACWQVRGGVVTVLSISRIAAN